MNHAAICAFGIATDLTEVFYLEAHSESQSSHDRIRCARTALPAPPARDGSRARDFYQPPDLGVGRALLPLTPDGVDAGGGVRDVRGYCGAVDAVFGAGAYASFISDGF